MSSAGEQRLNYAWKDSRLFLPGAPLVHAVSVLALASSEVLAFALCYIVVVLVFGTVSDNLGSLLRIGTVSYGVAATLFGLYPGRGMFGPHRIRLRAVLMVASLVSPAVVVTMMRTAGFGMALGECILAALLVFCLGTLFEMIAIRLMDGAGLWRTPALFRGDEEAAARIRSDLALFPELGLELVDFNDDTAPLGLRAAAVSSSLEHNAPAFLVDTSAPLPAFMPLGRTNSDGGGAVKETISRVLKRTIDIVGASLGLVILSPVMVASAAVIWIYDGRPFFFCQPRGGKDGKIIRVWKFRSMYRDAGERLDQLLRTDPAAKAEWNTFFKLRNDPRILPRIGNFIRRSSVDELPQLWNVLRGDMSLVGPRPFPENHLAAFSREFRDLRARAIPGITGLWQVTLRSDGDLEAQERLDRAYVTGWSFWLDLYILFRTPLALLSSRGAR